MEDRVGIYEELFGPIIKWVVIILLSILTVGIAWVVYVVITESLKGKGFLAGILYVVKIPYRIAKAFVMDFVNLFRTNS